MTASSSVTDATSHLEARAVSKRFHPGTAAEVAALTDVSLQVARGSFVALTGPSGGGKTTLLSILGALDRPSAGVAMLSGTDLVRASDAERARLRRRLGFVFQSSPMLRGLAAWENATYPLVPMGTSRASRRARAVELFARVGLDALLEKKPEELSGGELQRVGIARALVAEPEAVLADEPTSHLDRFNAEAVTRLLEEIHAAGATVVVATHDERLLRCATATYEIVGGRLA